MLFKINVLEKDSYFAQAYIHMFVLTSKFTVRSNSSLVILTRWVARSCCRIEI